MTRIVSADSSHREAWEGFVMSHPQAAPYHRWAWGEAVGRAYGFRQASLLALRDGQVAGVLPMVFMRAPGARGRLVSLPYCDFGGPLSVDGQTASLLLEHALERARTRGATEVVMRKPEPDAIETSKVLMRLLLPDGSANLLKSFPAKLRSQVKKPQREGLTIASGGEALLDAFYHVFTRNMRDLGSPTHSLKWFRLVIQGFGDAARVWVVYLPDGRAAAASITLVHGRVTFVPWASSVREFNHSNPNMLLYWAMLSEAADAGQRAFEFGRSTPGEGTYRFKKQWGAEAMGLNWEVHDPVTGKTRTAFSGARVSPFRRLAETCWRQLPLGAANAVGPLLRRHISL